jgi:ribonuclease PH
MFFIRGNIRYKSNKISYQKKRARDEPVSEANRSEERQRAIMHASRAVMIDLGVANRLVQPVVNLFVPAVQR